jgi:CRP-like cAMP-binding protein
MRAVAYGGTVGEETTGYGNAILDALSPSALEGLAPYLVPVSLARRQQLASAGDEMRDVYFPVSCVASWLSVFPGGGSIEVATIGNEGIVGAPLIYGERRVPFLVMVQVPGDALSLPADHLVAALGHNAHLRGVLSRYLNAFVVQLGQSGACNGLHSATARCARWLLMTLDRVPGQEFGLTHELLAEMIGVARQTVSEALRELQDRGAIQLAWGQVRVSDRERLEQASCECYGIIARAYADVHLDPDS